MKNKLSARLHDLHPSISKFERLTRISVGILGFDFVVMLILLVLTKGTPPSELNQATIFLTVAAIFIFFAGTGFYVLFDGLTDKSYAKAIDLWDKMDKPSNDALARISVSHELRSAQRKAAAKVLDRRDPLWRQKALSQSCSQIIGTEIIVPTMKVREKEDLYTLLFAPIALTAVGLLVTALVKNFGDTSQAWPWFTSGLLLLGVFLFLADRFIDKPNQELRKRWEEQIRQDFSVEQLIEFEAANGKVFEGRLIRSWLDRNSPGWTLTPTRPLWAVACACEED